MLAIHEIILGKQMATDEIKTHAFCMLDNSGVRSGYSSNLPALNFQPAATR
jgi:hypothetical protein